MIVLVDADSLVWSSCYRKKENIYDTGMNNIEDAKSKFDEVLMSIINTIEETYELDKVIVFNGSRGNFRNEITKDYKANRIDKEIPIVLNQLHEYVKEQYESISGVGVETDDVVATYWTKLSKTFGRNNVMIVSIDKDYKQLPCIIYDYHYKKKRYYNISKQEAKRFFFEQMIIGDSADNVNYCKGYGKSYCEAHLTECNSDYSYFKGVFSLYKKIYDKEARQKFIECYNLLKLRTE